MGIYQQGTKKPKSTSTKEVKGLIFENKYFDREEREDGMVVLRPKANVKFDCIEQTEEYNNIKMSVVGMEEVPADTTSSESTNEQRRQ